MVGWSRVARSRGMAVGLVASTLALSACVTPPSGDTPPSSTAPSSTAPSSTVPPTTLPDDGPSIERLTAFDEGVSVGGSSIDGDASVLVYSVDAVGGAEPDGILDVYVQQIESGSIRRLTHGNGDSYGASISADGTTVVFTSVATDLVAGDDNGAPDVFRHVLATDTTSRPYDGPLGSSRPLPDRDGTTIAFDSFAAGVLGGVTPSEPTRMRWDLNDGVRVLEVGSTIGVPTLPDPDPSNPGGELTEYRRLETTKVISPNGRWIAWGLHHTEFRRGADGRMRPVRIWSSLRVDDASTGELADIAAGPLYPEDGSSPISLPFAIALTDDGQLLVDLLTINERTAPPDIITTTHAAWDLDSATATPLLGGVDTDTFMAASATGRFVAYSPVGAVRDTVSVTGAIVVSDRTDGSAVEVLPDGPHMVVGVSDDGSEVLVSSEQADLGGVVGPTARNVFLWHRGD